MCEKCGDQSDCRKRSRDYSSKAPEPWRICLITLRRLIGCKCNIVKNYGCKKHIQTYSMILDQWLICALYIRTHNNNKGRNPISKKFWVWNWGNEIAITAKPSICIHREDSRSNSKKREGDVIRVIFLGWKWREMKNCDHCKIINLSVMLNRDC